MAHAPRIPDMVFLLVMRNISSLSKLDAHPLPQFLSISFFKLLLNLLGSRHPVLATCVATPSPPCSRPPRGRICAQAGLTHLRPSPFIVSPVWWLPGQSGNSWANARDCLFSGITELSFQVSESQLQLVQTNEAFPKSSDYGFTGFWFQAQLGAGVSRTDGTASASLSSALASLPATPAPRLLALFSGRLFPGQRRRLSSSRLILHRSGGVGTVFFLSVTKKSQNEVTVA